MLELKETAPGTVTLWEDGAVAGGAVWTLEPLTWGKESVQVANLTRFDAPEEDQAALLAYLRYLWEPHTVAAAQWPDGRMEWFHTALERSYRAYQEAAGE